MAPHIIAIFLEGDRYETNNELRKSRKVSKHLKKQNQSDSKPSFTLQRFRIFKKPYKLIVKNITNASCKVTKKLKFPWSWYNKVFISFIEIFQQIDLNFDS